MLTSLHRTNPPFFKEKPKGRKGFSKLNSIYLAFPAIINRSGDAFVLQYTVIILLK